MKYLLPLALLLSLTFACGGEKSTPANAADTAAPLAAKKPGLELAWETDTVLRTVESVYYDRQRKQLYTGNIEENPWGMDGQGSIGRLSLTGEVLDVQFVTGLNAPKGMAMHGDRLYVADIDAVVAIDVDQRRILKRIEIPGAKALNDIDVTADGILYVSDSDAGKVYAGRPDGEFRTVTEGMERPNGVLVTETDGILLGDTRANTLSRLNADGSREILVEGVSPDGIVALAEGGYVISRWGGEIHYISPEWEAVSLFTSAAPQDKTADIFYVPEEHLLLVPTFFGNRVRGYHVTDLVGK